jgi:two-component system sensor histidine kinase/response regulator
VDNVQTTRPKANILIADDTPANLRLLTGILAEHGHKVRAAPNGNLALQAAQSEPPDLILLDIMMPGLDGYAVCVQLKADARTRDIPVIFLSALTEAMDKVKAFSVGGVDYITKPFQTMEVLARVETHLALRNLQDKLREQNLQLQAEISERARANEELREFATIVSHDLRAPLLNLKGFAAELDSALRAIGPVLDGFMPQMDEEQRQAVSTSLNKDIPEALGFIDSSVAQMDRFVHALLKLSRLGRLELSPESIDLNALVQAVLKTMAHQIEERQVKVTVSPLPEVIADQTAMEQILSNLLDNAIKYLDPTRPGEIEIGAEINRGEMTFRIRDNGRGIAEDDMDKVFAPFRRAGPQDVPGEGMGLPYVQALVRRHGGRIWCESEPGEGTTFSFTISGHLTEGGESD